MKVTVEMDMTPEEARRLMGLPDLSPLQAKMVEEVQKRMSGSMDFGDVDSLIKAWMPLGALGAQGWEQFQKLMWDSAKAAGAGMSKKENPKT